MKHFCHAMLALFLTTVCADAVPVSLRVVDADARPIPGVSVEYIETNADTPDVAAKAQTGADGMLALDLRGFSSRAGANEIFIGDREMLGRARVRDAKSGFGIAALFAGENTLMLETGVRVSGVVKDAAGAPLAGASVEFLSAGRSETDYNSWNAQIGLPPIVALADAAGRWEIADLPRGYARFLVSAPGAARGELKVLVDETEVAAPDFQLRAAGTVRGRFLDYQGRPLAGVRVNLYDDFAAPVQTDARGRFELPSVAVGERELNFNSSAPDWLGADGEIKLTMPAQNAVVDVGDVRGDAGLLLSGTLVEAGSKTPLPFVPLQMSASSLTLQTDARGGFAARVKKPFFGLNVRGDYVQKWGMLTVPFEADKFDFGELAAARATRLPLDLRDEAGNSVPQATVSLRSPYGQTQSTRDANGASVGPLLAGEYQIEGAGLWDVIEPKSVTIGAPVAGQTVAPLRIRVRPLAPIRVSGRAVDGAGAPLARVQVKVKTRTGWQNAAAISDKNGDWTVELSTAYGEPVFDGADLAPFAFVRGGALARQGETSDWKSDDIVLARTGIALAGRVVDAAGVGVTNARVSWQGNPKSEFAATDANGNFEIADAPLAALSVLASDGPRLIAATATPGVPIELKLPPATAPLSSGQVDELWDKTQLRDLYNLESVADVLGAARIYRVARRLDGEGNPARIGDGLSSYLRLRARRARTRTERFDVAAEGVELLRAIPMDKFDDEGAARIAVLAARTDDAELRKWAALWYDARRPRMPKTLDEMLHVLRYTNSLLIATEFRMSAVGAALGRADAEKYRVDALTLMRNFPGDYARLSWSRWGEMLWMSDPARFDDEIANWTKSQQMAFIVGALNVVDDAPRAKQLWAHLEKLGADAELLATEAAAEKNSTSWLNSTQWLPNGRTNYARAVAALDAPNALSALEQIGNAPDACAIALGIARAARANGRPELARRALQIGLDGIYSNTSGTLALAMEARDFDAPLAEQLLGRFRERVLSEESAREEGNRDQGWRDVAAYAFALRDFDAATGRLLLEDQWIRRRNAPAVVGRGEENYDAINQQQDLAWAMAAYDAPRALQWLGEIKDERDENNNRLAMTRIAIMAVALATPEQRPFLLADHSFN